jgi:hypothetical protein
MVKFTVNQLIKSLHKPDQNDTGYWREFYSALHRKMEEEISGKGFAQWF